MTGHFQQIQGLSEEALVSIERTFGRNPRSYTDGTWESQRLAEAKTEIARRKAKRRGRVGE